MYIDELEAIRFEIEEIKKRNIKVEAENAWETSLTRRLLITLMTYFSVALYLEIVEIRDLWINAIVPVIGFSLSTLTLPFFKSFCWKYIYRAQRRDSGV